ncbi:hypothetical protein ACP70R_028784 [Stipagrostis hirtigluma subsp. patula]
MAAYRQEHAMIQIADEHAAGAWEEEHGARDRPATSWQLRRKCCCRCCLCVLGVTVLALLALGVTVVVLQRSPEYSVAVAACLPGLGAAPSDAAGGGGGAVAVPALFNLTVHVKNPNRVLDMDGGACVTKGATAAVSYNGTKVAAGAVPPFCAGKGSEREAVAPVWGTAGDDAPALLLAPHVALALRTRGAVVDVAVRIPHVCNRGDGRYDDRMLACSVKVGEGPSPCTY